MTNDPPEFDKIIAALRSSASADELSGEDAAVEAMASTLASTPSTVRSLGSARSLRVVAVVAAGLIGMGGIAAAGAATLRPARDTAEISTADTVVDTTTPASVVATTSPATTSPATTVAETTVPGTGVETLVDDPATEFDETQCAEGNHGATVSSIAKETPPGPGHGEVVSDAAHSSCGKNADDDATDDTTVAPVDDPTTDFDETQCADGNHGATVSSIARATPPGPGHGEEVSDAAHSSCGKDTAPDDDASDDTATDDEATDDGTATTVAATDDDSPGNSDGHGNSNGHGNGNGNSGGNGNGRGNGKPGG
ncbi:MAG TPA: hypothetical protein VNO51_08475 [Ilumatobacteraceae bacterium]|nr:hypothetical protein [Ilumatobacteraceae bacterium]